MTFERKERLNTLRALRDAARHLQVLLSCHDRSPQAHRSLCTALVLGVFSSNLSRGTAHRREFYLSLLYLIDLSTSRCDI